jgi:hypothetical protein
MQSIDDPMRPDPIRPDPIRTDPIRPEPIRPDPITFEEYLNLSFSRTPFVGQWTNDTEIVWVDQVNIHLLLLYYGKQQGININFNS